jgi:glycerate dehydrogenase
MVSKNRKYKIVVLDGYTLNPGDLDCSKLTSVGECTTYPRTLPEDVINRSLNADILITNKVPITGDAINRLPNLKYIGVLATGYDIVDIEAAKRRNIPVTNVPTYGTKSVAQMTFAHILNLTQHVAQHSETVKQGKWSESKDFCYWDYPLIELAELNLGIIGFGRIGQAVGRIALAFGMNVLIYSRTIPKQLVEGVKKVDLEDIFRLSDILSLHCPLTEETRYIVNKNTLKLMKNGAFLINTARGALVDNEALAEALNSDQIAGAGLDVLETEPPQKDNPLLSAENCYITPHIAWATKAARKRLLDVVVKNVKAFIDGNPQNVVNM